MNLRNVRYPPVQNGHPKEPIGEGKNRPSHLWVPVGADFWPIAINQEINFSPSRFNFFGFAGWRAKKVEGWEGGRERNKLLRSVCDGSNTRDILRYQRSTRVGKGNSRWKFGRYLVILVVSISSKRTCAMLLSYALCMHSQMVWELGKSEPNLIAEEATEAKLRCLKWLPAPAPREVSSLLFHALCGCLRKKLQKISHALCRLKHGKGEQTIKIIQTTILFRTTKSSKQQFYSGQQNNPNNHFIQVIHEICRLLWIPKSLLRHIRGGVYGAIALEAKVAAAAASPEIWARRCLMPGTLLVMDCQKNLRQDEA